MTDSFKEELKDEEYRYGYAESFLNSSIATQLAVIRDQRGMTQEQLADLVGTKQTGISRIENANYSGWSIKMLKKIARALGCRLRVSFETFGTLLDEDKNFNEESLKRPKFEDDRIFFPIASQVPDELRPAQSALVNIPFPWQRDSEIERGIAARRPNTVPDKRTTSKPSGVQGVINAPQSLRPLGLGCGNS